MLASSPSARVGAIPAQFNINGNGGANYSIEIEVPPGTDGVQPNISLAYDSQSGNGLVGVGWNLSGFSAINRCSKNIATDGIRAGVNFDSNDRFCLDGQRLMAIEGNYGNNDTKYHTERETWIDVISHTESGKNGPRYFTALTRDGHKLQFGGTEDSQIGVRESDGAIRVWALNKITDRQGNYIEIKYYKNNLLKAFRSVNIPFLGYYPKEIRYTGNSGLIPQRLVKFNYENRKDITISYVGGSKAQINKRLASIKTYVDLDGDGANIEMVPNLVKEYKLSYEYGIATNRSRLIKLEECDKEGACLPGTKFEFLDLSNNSSDLKLSKQGDANVGKWNPNTSHLVGDVNGDGLTDLIELLKNGSQYKAIVWGNTGEKQKFFNKLGESELGKWSLNNNYLAVDVNGDGLTDLIELFKNGSQYKAIVWGNTGEKQKFFNELGGSEVGKWTKNTQYFPIDTNGDGLNDLIELWKNGGTTESRIWRNTGNQRKPFSIGTVKNLGEWRDNNQYFPIDTNGNGLNDLIKIWNNGEKTQAVIWNSTGNEQKPFLEPKKSYLDIWRNNTQYFPLDINGDSLKDLVGVWKDGTKSKSRVWINTADEKSPFSRGGENDLGVWESNTQYFPLDVNGDSLSDLIEIRKDGIKSKSRVWINTANEKSPFLNRGERDLETWQINTKYLSVDINGDGLTDLLEIKKNGSQFSSTTWSLDKEENDYFDLLSNITNGLGKRIYIQYKPITDKGIYSKQSVEKYPRQDVQTPLYVVSRYEISDKSNNPSNQFVFEHKYQGAKVDLHRGWMGFEKTISLDLQNDTQTVNTYSTKFPLLGMIVSEEIFHDDSLLGKVATDYGSSKDDKGIYKVWKTSIKSQYYTEGNEFPDYVLEKKFYYDLERKNVTLIADLGDNKDSENNDNVYTCTKFYNSTNDEWWKSFMPIQQKVVRTESACNNPETWNRWNANTDLSWEKYDYDDHMNLISRSQYLDRNGIDSDRGKWLVSRSTYDDYGNVISTTDPQRNTSKITFDSTYHTFPVKYTTPRVNSINQPLETITSYEPKFGIKTSVIDPNKHKIMEIPDRGIDGFGRVLEVRGIKPDSNAMVTVATTEYNSENSGMSLQSWYRTQWEDSDISNSDTWLWDKEYIDALGRNYLTESKGSNNQTKLIEKVEFNNKGQIEREYLPYYLGNKQNFSTYQYDIRGQVTQVTTPNQAVTKTDYSKQYSDRQLTYQSPNPTDNTDGSNFVSSSVKETSRGWVEQKIAPDNSKALYEYDHLGRVIKIIDPLGEETQIVYNSLGKVLSETNPETGTKKYIYNDNGKLTSYIDAKQQRLSFEYDNNGRITKKQIYDNQNDQNPTKVVSYEYDDPSIANSKGNLTKITMPEGIYSFAYNNLGEVKEEKVQVEIGGQQKVFVTGYTYDAAGRPDLITYPDGSIVRFSYNYQGQLNTIELKEAGESNFTTYATYEEYTDLGELGKVVYNNGVESEYKYDEIGRIKRSKTKKGGFSYLDFTYEWNKANNLLKIDDQTERGLTETFQYNEVARLIGATGPYPSLTYDYDLAGNIIKLNDEIFDYDLERKHQLADVQYDANGNTKADAPWSYIYDAEDRLIRVEKEESGSTIEVNRFTYDDSGDRLIKTDSDGTKTYYVSPLYEVVQQPSGSEIHTKYIIGPQGVVAAISKNGSNVNLLAQINYNTANQEADMYSMRSWASLPLSLSAKISQIIYYPDFESLLVVVTIVGSLLFTLLLWAYQFFRSASRESWVGKARGLILQRLVELSWITSDTANRLNTPIPTTWLMIAWHRPGSFALVLVAFSSINLTGISTLATLTPGANGAGYPEYGQTLYFHHGHLGSTSLVTDTDGNEISIVNYEPYGEIADSSEGQDIFRSKFTEKEFDKNIDLYYFGSRYYNASLGRFLTPDPAKQYFSPYVYGDSNPLNGVDSNGEAFFTLSLLVGTALLGGAYAGGAAVNNNLNPASWDWNSGKNWAGVIGGAAIGGLAVGFGIAAPGVIASATGISSTAASVPLSGGIMGAMNASFTAMAGENVGEIASAFGLGVGMGALFATPGIGGLAFLGNVGYNTSNVIADPSVENGIALAMDLIDLGITAAPRLRKGGKSQKVNEEAAPSCSSFAAGTLVLTSEGEKAIEDIEVGDMVWAYDEETGEEALYPVSHLFTRIAPELVLITAGEEVIESTTEHEFYVDNKGWVKAENLKVGDELLRSGDKTARVAALQLKEENLRVYNIEIDEAHTYYVSEREVLVHNPCKTKPDTRRAKAIRTGMDRENIVTSKRERKPPERFQPGEVKPFYETIVIKGKPRNGLNPGTYYLRKLEIAYTGSRKGDFKLANQYFFGSDDTPQGLVWHHYHDYDQKTGMGTMYLMEDKIHTSMPHWGGVSQWSEAYKMKYGS
ncbi:MAG: polymorphic toxin-type HINT domain-containing protein [Prochloraceae cyanobacterium]|nr:polymorphic toxin-type HINT domain-containing protein [Prochloraceae cyanobacterium]